MSRSWMKRFFSRKPRATKKKVRPYRPYIESLEDRLTPSSVRFDGGGDGSSWSDPLNWDTDTVPGVLDDVSIPYAGTAVNVGSASVNSLACNATFILAGSLTLAADSSITRYMYLNGTVNLLDGATLSLREGGELSGTFNVAAGAKLDLQSGTYTFNGGVISGDGLLAIGSGAIANIAADVDAENSLLESDGEIAGDAVFLVTNNLDWTSGTMSGSGMTDVDTGAVCHIFTSGTKQIFGRRIDNDGHTIWSEGGIGLSGITFNNGGTFTLEFDGSLSDANSTFNNNSSATFEKTAGIAESEFQVVFHNDGLVDVQAARLFLTAGGSSSGTFQVAGGTRVDFASSTFEVATSTRYVGAGEIRARDLAEFNLSPIVNTPLTIDANFQLTQGTFRGQGAITVQASRTFTWSGGTLRGTGLMEFQSGSSLVINGTVLTGDSRQIRLLEGTTTTWTEGDIVLNSDELFENRGNFTADAATPLRMAMLLDNGIFENRGTFTKSGADVLTISILSFRNTSLGEIRLNAGEFRAGGVTFNNEALVTVSAGTFSLEAGAGVHDGVFNTAAGAKVVIKAGLHAFDSTVFGVSNMMNGAGLYAVQDSGKLDVTGIVRGSNFLLTEGGSLRGTGTFGAVSFSWAGGTMEGAGGVTEVRQGDVMAIGNGTGASMTLSLRTLRNLGNITWSGQGDIVNSSADIILDGTNGEGVFTIDNSQHITGPMLGTGTLTIQNGGKLRKVADQQTVIEMPVVNNNSRIEVFPFDIWFKGGLTLMGAAAQLVGGGGVLTVTGNFTQNGGTSTITGGTLDVSDDLELAGGTLSTSGASLTVAGDFRVTGGLGTIDTGSAAVTGDVIVSGGTLALNADLTATTLSISSGGTVEAYSIQVTANVVNAGTLGLGSSSTVYGGEILVISGDFTTTGVVRMDLGASAHDRVSITGAADLGGTLEILFESGYEPNIDDAFEMLDYASLSGAFSTYLLPSLTSGTWAWWYDLDLFGLRVDP